MSDKTLKFNNTRVIKKEFHKSKQPIDLISVNTKDIVASYKFRYSDEGFKYFIGYQDNEIVKPFCIISPHMSTRIKYFENGQKSISIMIRDDNILDKYN